MQADADLVLDGGVSAKVKGKGGSCAPTPRGGGRIEVRGRDGAGKELTLVVFVSKADEWDRPVVSLKADVAGAGSQLFVWSPGDAGTVTIKPDVAGVDIDVQLRAIEPKDVLPADKKTVAAKGSVRCSGP
ncbi:MAG TPA: hypothetical protein VKE22_23235 [Haliangiales bacterium]|nr:hypothetical protein [Haliangiales bacterium]